MRRPRDEAVQEAPRRLVEGTDRTAALLWRALKAPPPPGSPKNISALVAKRNAQVRRMRFGVALVAACLPLGTLLWSERPKTELLIHPERLGSFTDAMDSTSGPPPTERDTVQPDSPGSTTEPTAEGKSAAATARREGSSAAGPRLETTTSSDVIAEGRSTPPAGLLGSPQAPSSAADERCSAWTSQGDYGAAAECYDRKARGTGVSAEWALLEKARIHSRAQGKPAEALRTLDEYDDRFPEGSLAREARLTRIEILTSARRTQDALRALDETLQHDQIPERTGELLLLRAQLRADSDSCTGAIEDMDAALKRGIAPTRARSIREKCPR